MARADTQTLLPLDTWARIVGLHPLHFNGVEVADLASATVCGQPIMQFAWQTANAVSREDIANAIADAEDRIAQWTKFRLLPTFESDERHQWPRNAMPELYATSMMNVRGQVGAIKANYGHIIAGGVKGLTLISGAAPIVYTDTDGDGYDETATVVVSTSVTDANEIALFYPSEDGDPAWEIRPIRVRFSGSTATITFRREQCVNPGLLESFDGRGVDGLDATKFLTTADVYRLWHDPSQQAQFLWENANNACGCANGGCTTCYMAAQFGCATVRDWRTGLIAPGAALWNDTTQNFENTPLAITRAPDRVRLWYRAGFRDNRVRRPMVEMGGAWARAVAYFSTALLTRPMCSCQAATSAIEYWQDDMAKQQTTQSGGENFQLDRALLGNPFGTTRGAIYAWNVFRNEAIGEAVSV